MSTEVLPDLGTHFHEPVSWHVWDAKYRYREGAVVRDQTIEDTWRRVARALAVAEPESEQARWAERFYRVLYGFKFLPGGRILAGAGTRHRVTLFNCFVMGIIEDSLDGIFDSLKEGALTMQQGGGVGYDFSTLRPAGTRARTTGTIASGPVSFMHIWDAMCATLLSTGARRGAMMATLRCDHPDIEAFITAKQRPGMLTHFNLSVQVFDAFMEAVRRDADWPLVFPAAALEDEGMGDGPIVYRRWTGTDGPVPCRVLRVVKARALWEQILRATYDYAEPGVLFIDTINRMNNLAYREHITATNPCVTADTWIHTSMGPRRVADLIGQPFFARVNGQDYMCPKGFFATGVKKVYRLETLEGYNLRLTEDHPVLRVRKRTRWSTTTEWIPVKYLQIGDGVVLNNHRGCFEWPGEGSEEEGYLLGLLVGDGTLKKDKAVLSVWTNNDSIESLSTMMAYAESAVRSFPHRKDFRGWIAIPERGEYRLATASLRSLAYRFGLRPGAKIITSKIEKASSDFYKGFLRGLFDADGSVQGSHFKGISIRLAQSNLEILRAVQRMLLRLGIVAKIYSNRRPSGKYYLPDGKGGVRLYHCRAQYELVISKDNLQIFAERIGFSHYEKAKKLKEALQSYKRSLNKEVFIARIARVKFEGYETVYDACVPGINAFDANGFVVHNCGEQPLPPYGACDLGSINLARFVRAPFTPEADLDWEGIRETVAVAVRMLDNVIDVSGFPMPAQAEQARGTRRIGLGITGLADALIMLGLHYASEEARRLAARIMQTICHTAYRTSIALAREKGAFPFFERERYLESPFIQALPEDIRKGIATYGIRNSHLLSIAPTGTISLLANNVSSGIEPVFAYRYTRYILGLDGERRAYTLTDYALRLWQRLHGDSEMLPEAFVDAQHLDPYDHLKMQAALQPYVDGAISKTVNVPADTPFNAFRQLYDWAYDHGLKGCTTYRPSPVRGAVLEAVTAGVAESTHCCSIEREAD